MLYFPDFLIDSWIMDDVNMGDLTTHCLGIGHRKGEIIFSLKAGGRVSGIRVSRKILTKLGLNVIFAAEDGVDLEKGATIICAEGPASALHQSWKVCQNILEWSSGVAGYMAEMLKCGRLYNPDLHIACTRKNIPGTKLLAHESVLNGGGLIHRGGTAETVLLFANHRSFFPEPDNWNQQIENLRKAAPEKKIVVEADNFDDLKKALDAAPDFIQLDKFNPEQLRQAAHYINTKQSSIQVSAAGGINKENVADFAKTGFPLLVTSAPYYAKPVDVKVVLQAIDE